MSWKDFRPIAEHTEYSNVYGEHNITPDLYVSMNDGSWLQYGHMEMIPEYITSGNGNR